jgi:hypothetical protein
VIDFARRASSISLLQHGRLAVTRFVTQNPNFVELISSTAD